uniref:Fork-head domain-containing protein n=1 Tax=Caenorhabditis tropicalis TaxID=1561998 RepID=A0A1I7T1E0_9PELO
MSVLCSVSSLFICLLHSLLPPSTFLSSDVWTSFFFFFAKPLTTYLFRETQTTSYNITAFNMEQVSGMEMMLSAMVSPLDDDLPWQFDDQIIKENDTLDSAAQSPSSSLFSDFDDACPSSFSSSLSSPSFTTTSDSGTSSLSSFDMMMSMFPDPTNPTVNEERNVAPAPTRKNVVVRRRPRECSMVCWLFRTLLTSEYRALPVNAIFEIFEETMQQSTAGSGRHYRQSIRHCLMTSAVFVRVLTPNPRKDFLVMNEQGSWWTVHPDCEIACAEHVFKTGTAHRCPPQASIPAYYARVRMEEAKAASSGNSNTLPIRTQYGYSSVPSSECSSTSSSSASSPAPVNVRRFDPIRKVAHGSMSNGPRVTYKTVSTGYPHKATNGRTDGFTSQQTLLNPRSILLNDITVDHEEVV